MGTKSLSSAFVDSVTKKLRYDNINELGVI